ncbi:MAG: protein kinase [Pirellulaceae bacterium]
MMTATQCPNQDQLHAFSLGQLPGEQSDELVSHLNECPACQAELDTFHNGDDSLIASLQSPSEFDSFQAEPDCQTALAKALGALADADSFAPSLAKLTPQRIGEYEIVRPLGTGGMGNVFLARHTKLGREVALKVLAHHRLGDKRMAHRFEAEMQAVGRLSHPNVVTAHDAREVNGMAVLITEFIDGFDLGELIKRTGPLSVDNACEIVRQVAVALEYTSQQGFVHRDVKPSNIMLGRHGHVKLLDLGLARLQFTDTDRPDMTGTGQAMGTADFIAPEQVTDSKSVDIRADIYSLGCTLFKLLTGVAPFESAEYPTAFAKMTAHVSTAAPRLSELLPNSPAKLARLVESMLAKQPDDRPTTPMDVANQLAEFAVDFDLPQLVSAAEQNDATAEQVVSPVRTSTTNRPTTKSVFGRRVSIGLLIATGFFSLLLGFLLGVIVTIEYPDGTIAKLLVPDGGKAEVRQEQKADLESETDLAKRLQGMWLFIERNTDGRPLDTRAENLRYSYTKDGIVAFTGATNPSGTFSGTLRSDGKTYTIDQKTSDTRSHKGIVRFLDSNTVEFCWGDNEYPAEFQPDETKQQVVTKAVRVSTDVGNIPAPFVYEANVDLAKRLHGMWRATEDVSRDGKLHRYDGVSGYTVAFTEAGEMFLPLNGDIHGYSKFIGRSSGEDFYSIDWRTTETRVTKGIVRFLGPDKIEMCMCEVANGERPTEFKANKSKFHSLRRMVRVSKDVPEVPVASKKYSGDDFVTNQIGKSLVFIGLISETLPQFANPLPASNPSGKPIVCDNVILCRINNGNAPKVKIDGVEYAAIDRHPDSLFSQLEPGCARVSQANDKELRIDLDAETGKRFEQFTKKHLKRELAIVADGQIVTAATLHSPISHR